MTGFDLLLRILGDIKHDFQLPEHINKTNKDVLLELKDEPNDEPLLVDGNKITVYAQNRIGGELTEAIFENSEELMQKGERTIEREFGKLIHEAEPYSDMLKRDTELLASVREFVPPSDIPIINASLFIRRLYKKQASVTRYKMLINQQYLSRGTNISNLVSADYYDDYLLPTFLQLKETEGELAKEIFDELYEEAVTQYPFAVFVSSRKSYTALKEGILGKINVNVLNGRHNLNIHGIGEANRKTILKILKDDDITRLYTSEPDIVVLKNTIYARIYF